MMQQQTTATSSDEGFAFAVHRLASMQGGSVDPLLLHEAQERIAQATDPLRQLKGICRHMGWSLPAYPSRPDPVKLPLLCYTTKYKWAVVIEQNPQGQWVLVKADGVHAVDEHEIVGQLVSLKFGPNTQLGWGLLKASDTKPTFFAHIRSALRLYKSEILEACLATVFIGILALATSLYSMQVYDRVIPTRGHATLVVLTLGVILCILIELVIKFTRSQIMDHVVVGMDSRLSREVFQRLLQLRVDQIPASVGTLAGQLRGYEQLRNFYTASTLFTLIDLPLALCLLVVVTWIASPWVALVPAVAAGLVFVLGISMRQKTQLYARQGAALANMKTGLLVEAVEGAETIKAGTGGWKFLSRWIDVNNTTIQSDLKMRRISEGTNYWMATLQQIGYAGIIVVGALVVMRGDMTMGALIACSILGGRILAPIMALPGLMVQHAHAQAALEGIERLYSLKTEQENVDQPLAPDRVHGHYRLESIKFSYPDCPPSLVVPHFNLQSGERVAVIGPIGSGKSTLLRMLTGLYQPQEGRVLLDNLDLSHIQRQVLNQHVGYLQQDHRLFQGTLRENLLIGLPDPGDEALLQAMRRTGMNQFVATHPKGLARPIAEGGKGLSGGQKQLLAFTRLVLCEPSILLLDEPTATMDEHQERKCLEVLQQEVHKGKTLVLVTHKPNLLSLVDRVVVIIANHIVLDGPRDSVLQQLKQRNLRASAAVTAQPNSLGGQSVA
jgi:ATP-binding cassette subfamily C protein LapB